MTDIEIDEITRELSRFGQTAAATFNQWRRYHPEATKAPTWLWKEMNRQSKKDRTETRLRVRKQLREQAARRSEQRAETKAELTSKVDVHRHEILEMHRRPGSTEQFQRRQWELATDRAAIEHSIHQADWLTAEQRGQAVEALEAAHHAHLPGVQPLTVWSDRSPLGMTALKARAAERVSRIKLGLLQRGRTLGAHRRERDRAAAANPAQRREELDRLIAVGHRMWATNQAHTERFPTPHEPGDRFPIFDVDKQWTRNAREFERRLVSMIDTAGLNYGQWRTYRDAVHQIPAAELDHARNMSTEDLQANYRIQAAPDWVQRVESTRSMGRYWDHDLPEQAENALRAEFVNPPTDWQPPRADAEDRYVVFAGSDGDDRPHARAFRWEGDAHDWAINKLHWVARDDQAAVSVTVWDRHWPLDENGQIRRTFAVENFTGSRAQVCGSLRDRREMWREIAEMAIEDAARDDRYPEFDEHAGDLDREPQVPDGSRSTLKPPDRPLDRAQIEGVLHSMWDYDLITDDERSKLLRDTDNREFASEDALRHVVYQDVAMWRGEEVEQLRDNLEKAHDRSIDDLARIEDIGRKLDQAHEKLADYEPAYARGPLAAEYVGNELGCVADGLDISESERAQLIQHARHVDFANTAEVGNWARESVIRWRGEQINTLEQDLDDIRAMRSDDLRYADEVTRNRDELAAQYAIAAQERADADREVARVSEHANDLAGQLAEKDRLIAELTSERDRFRTERDEAVQKLVRSTPNRDRYGAPERIATEQPAREELPTDRGPAECGRDFGVPVNGDRTPDAPELVTVPERNGAHEMEWEGFSR
ncbi:hypothetical protein [Nocardia africana]